MSERSSMSELCNMMEELFSVSFFISLHMTEVLVDTEWFMPAKNDLQNLFLAKLTITLALTRGSL